MKRLNSLNKWNVITISLFGISFIGFGYYLPLIGFIIGWIGMIFLVFTLSFKKYLLSSVAYFGLLGIIVFLFFELPGMTHTGVEVINMKGIAGIPEAFVGGAILGLLLYIIISFARLMSLITTFFYVALKVALGVFKSGAGAAGTTPTFGEAIVLAIILGIVVVAIYYTIYYGATDITFAGLGLPFLACYTSGSTLVAFHRIATGETLDTIFGGTPLEMFGPNLNPIIIMVFLISVLVSIIYHVLSKKGEQRRTNETV